MIPTKYRLHNGWAVQWVQQGGKALTITFASETDADHMIWLLWGALIFITWLPVPPQTLVDEWDQAMKEGLQGHES